jgi:hypothetical protein
LKISIAAFDRTTLVRIVAIDTAHLAFQHRVMMRQLELGPDFEMTLETGVRRLEWVNDISSAAAGFHVFAARSMTRFASHRFRVLASSS